MAVLSRELEVVIIHLCGHVSVERLAEAEAEYNRMSREQRMAVRKQLWLHGYVVRTEGGYLLTHAGRMALSLVNRVRVLTRRKK